MPSKSVFISYCHLEKHWLKRLGPYLGQLGRDGLVDFWDDTRIKAGANWRSEIRSALNQARAAILLIGPGFLASEFITKHELPTLLDGVASRGITIYPLVVGYCGYESSPLKAFQAFNEPKKPLEALTKPKQNKILNDLSMSLSLEMLKEAPQNKTGGSRRHPAAWQHDRVDEYKRTDGYMLVHTYRRSSLRAGQEYEIFVFLVRHRKGTTGPPKRDFKEIKHAEFFFGDSWDNQVFSVPNIGGLIGVRTAAWGTFLATCRITFVDPARNPITLHRYIDFEMAVRKT